MRASGELEAAAQQYIQAATTRAGILAYADEPAALQNLGLVRMQQKRFDEAERALRAALERLRPGMERRRAVHNLAVNELMRGNSSEAERLLEPETTRSDALKESMYVRARALVKLGREGEAKVLVERAEGQPLPDNL